MRRLVKRILLTVALLLVVVIGASLVGMWMVRDVPDWYQPRHLTDAQRAAAAERAENAWIQAQSRLAEVHARQAAATTQKLVEGDPTGRVEISFSAMELNAFFDKWSRLNGWDQKFAQYLEDPQIVLHEGRLILAGKVKNLELMDGLVASVHFEPRITDRGELDLQLVRVLGGNLPMPDSVWEKQKQRLTQAIRARLPSLQQQAQVSPQGGANTEAVSAAMGRLFLQMMDHKASDPVVFIPIAGRGSIPVKVADVKVALDPAATGDDSKEPRLTLTVEAMTPREREEFLDRLRAPYHIATALTQ